jgi:hypothetical protein
VALSEITKEILFVMQVLETIRIILRLPNLVKVDNIGAIYLSNNFALQQKTKHIDISCHVVREFVEDGILKSILVRSEDNSADIHTNNISEETFIKHSRKNIQDVRYINCDKRKDVKKAYSLV